MEEYIYKGSGHQLYILFPYSLFINTNLKYKKNILGVGVCDKKKIVISILEKGDKNIEINSFHIDGSLKIKFQK